MIALGIFLALAIRVGLVLLFLPFSALDKLLNFKGAVAQAREAVPNRTAAVALIVAGLCVEVFMSLGVVTGIADRACAFVLAGYCAVTALLWKQFWKPGGLLDVECRTRADSVLGFSEEFRAGCRISADYIRNRRSFGGTVHRSSHGFLTSVSRVRGLDPAMKRAVAKGLARIEMVCGDPEALADFYQAAFGFLKSGRDLASAMGGCIELRLGRQTIRLIRAGPGGRNYPADVAGWSPLFQHIAIVVADMTRAYAHLSTLPGWKPISRSRPQTLPVTSGGASAFKFRDPEGHPLELIAFPPGAVPPQWQMTSQDVCLGIDHSAVSVSNTSVSVDFYESLGLVRSGGSLNVGPEQAILDDVSGAVVEVTALTPAQTTPHVELLCYQGDYDRRVSAQAADDVTATRLVLTVENRASLEAICRQHHGALLSAPALREHDLYCALLHDPDGHLIFVEAPA